MARRFAPRKPRLIGFVAGFLAIFLVAWLFLGAHTNHLNTQVPIPPGASITRIGKILQEQDVVSHWLVFAIAAKLSGEGGRLQNGIYRFPASMRVWDVVSSLHAGRYQVQVWLTFHEGITTRGIAAMLHERLGMNADTVLALTRKSSFLAKLGLNTPTLEGYLYPETYLCKLDDTPEKILTAMHQQFRKNILAGLKAQIAAQRRPLRDVMTMASIVEGETKKGAERSKVAGVYYNRLRRGMLLQADPTIQYIIPDGPRRLYYKDLRVPSPYNTYLHRGLPPGPVNNPGKAAVLAALFPESHPFLYFVADGTGGHRFSRTLAEHNAAVAAYRKLLTANAQ
jgi:UPF0755 protein